MKKYKSLQSALNDDFRIHEIVYLNYEQVYRFEVKKNETHKLHKFYWFLKQIPIYIRAEHFEDRNLQIRIDF